MFVAVRFEKREEAKEFMDSYAEREFMGYRCELSWFRDIRRYCAYQRTKQVRSNSQRRRRRSDSDESRHSSRRSSPARRSRSGSRENARDSRSPSRTSRSPSRSRSPRSRSRGSDRDRSRSRSNDRRSRSNERRSRSVSRGSRDDSRRSNRDESRNGHNDSMDRRSDDETRDRSRKRDSERRESRSKRRREPSESDDDVIEVRPNRKAKEDLPQIPLPPKAPTPLKPKTQSYIPPPSVDMEIDSPKKGFEPSPPHHTNPYQANQRSFQKEPSPANVHVTSYAVPMEEEAAPKLIIREPQPPAPIPAVAAYAASTYPSTQAQNPYAQHMHQQVLAPQQHAAAAPPAPVAVQQSPAPAQYAPPALAPTTPTSAAQQPTFVPRQVEKKIEICMPTSLPIPTPAPAPVPAPMSSASASNVTLNGASHFDIDPVLFPKSHKLFGHLKAFQTALLSTVKYEPPVKKGEDEELSTLRLSSFGQEEDTEESKALDREDKIARLTDEQMMRFHIKKKQFEAAFRNDCETYSVVTRALLNKDESLQFTLRMSLLENMEDLHKKMMQRVDDLLDQLLKMP